LGLDELLQPAVRDLHCAGPNCERKRRSFSNRSRMSSISYLSRATRSTPMPKAQPVTSSGSYPTLRSTFGCTIPEPRISSHPSCLQKRQPSPPHLKHSTSASADGSVNGKNEGRKRSRDLGPNICRANSSSVALRSAI